MRSVGRELGKRISVKSGLLGEGGEMAKEERRKRRRVAVVKM